MWFFRAYNLGYSWQPLRCSFMSIIDDWAKPYIMHHPLDSFIDQVSPIQFKLFGFLFIEVQQEPEATLCCHA